MVPVSKTTVYPIVVSAAIAVVVSAASVIRQQVLFHNEAGTLFIKLGPGASVDSYSFRLGPNERERVESYYGDITAIKLANTSRVMVTEL